MMLPARTRGIVLAMLHVSAVSPAELSAQVTSRLDAISGVANLVVEPGASRRPSGLA
jgi:hypothetical protein